VPESAPVMPRRMIAGRPEADVLAEAITLFARAHGVEELEIREPGLDREGAKWYSETDLVARLASVPVRADDLFDGARISLPAVQLLSQARLSQDCGLWCELRAGDDMVVYVEPGPEIVIGSDRPLPGAVQQAEQWGLQVCPGKDPLAALRRLPLRPADDGFWAEVVARTDELGAPLPCCQTWIVNVARCVLVDRRNVEEVRHHIRYRALVTVYDHPLEAVTAATRAAYRQHLLEAAERGEFSEVIMRLGGTGEIVRLTVDVEPDVEEWEAAVASADLIGRYGYGTDENYPSGALVAAQPDEDGIVRTRWLFESTR
jgi:hypothetical protein